MDDFLAWLEFQQWQIKLNTEHERQRWAAGFGMATEKQCDYFCQLYESAPMPVFLDLYYKKALARRISLCDLDAAIDAAIENLNTNQPDPRQQLKMMLGAGTMI